MTGGRRTALIVGVPVCLALVGATALSLVADIGNGSYPVSYPVPATTTALTMNVTGQLTIKPTTARTATLTGTAHYSVVRAALAEHTVGDSTTIGYGCSFPDGNCGLDATVTIPATITSLTANSGGGDATVNGFTGPVNLSTGDGNLSVAHASGPLTLNTNSGNIQVSTVRSTALFASSGDGDITAGGVTATTITANTNSGSITASGVATAKITASSGDGDIKVVFSSVPDYVWVNTDSGSITLVLPHGSTAYDISANTDSGSVSDGTVPQAKPSGHVITASTGSGSISITEQ
jgi:hypothetical protein